MNKNLNTFIENIQTGHISDIVTNKDRLRDSLCDIVIDHFSGVSAVKMLTLPSVWWKFEKLLAIKKRNSESDFFFHTTACERDRNIFNASCLNIPLRRKNRGLQYYYNEDYECDVLNSGLAKLHCMDIFTYMERTHHKFDLIWLDLVSPLNIFIDKLKILNERTIIGSLVTITFLKGRDQEKYCGKREQMISDILKNFKIISSENYFDTCPMIQLTYRKIKD